MASVVVTQTLDWKLHAFDVLSEFDGSNEAATGPMLVSLVFNCDPILYRLLFPFFNYAGLGLGAYY